MEIDHTVRPKSARTPKWDELVPSQQEALRELLECENCIDFEWADRDELEILRAMGWVRLSYRVPTILMDNVRSK